MVSIYDFKILYFSLEYCHLRHCIVSWGTATNSVLQSLEVVHNNILRTITYSNIRCHITPLYKSLNILKLHDIYKLELAKLLHKFYHEMLPTSFKTCFRKWLNFIVITQDVQPTKTILYKFQQTLEKKQFLIEKLLSGQL